VRIAVIGGKLQGLEILYLAARAGFTTLLLDKNTDIPAQNLCNQFIRFDFSCSGNWPKDIGEIDLIFPALEDLATLELIIDWGKQIGVPVVFDLDAYRISSSKHLSNICFHELKLPQSRRWPDCNFPVIVKPDNASGSEGVLLVYEQEEVERLLAGGAEKFVVEEYLEGPSYSIEVIGKPGNYVTLTITELFMDDGYDCCGVLAPAQLHDDYAAQLRQQALTIAEKLKLHGIMDLEVILHEGELKILEIDARFPSQTPVTVYHATGVNMVLLLADLFLEGRVTIPKITEGCSMFEHVYVTAQQLQIQGEHIIGGSNNLIIKDGFYGSTVAITNHTESNRQIPWVATLIFESESYDELKIFRDRCFDKIEGSQKSIGR
jgi:pyrrolysine biosynthesis protein PylC